LGMLYDRQGKPDKAFRATLAIEPGNIKAHRFLAKVLAAQGKADAAVYHYTELLRLQPTDADVHYNLGIALENQGKLAQAAEQYSAALEINPEYANAHYNLANLMARQGRFNLAIEHYQNTLAIDPRHIQALSNLALVYASRKEHQKALSLLLQLAELQPCALSYKDLPIALFPLDSPVAGLTILSLSINPSSLSARRNLVRCKILVELSSLEKLWFSSIPAPE